MRSVCIHTYTVSVDWFVFKNQVGRRAYFDIRKYSEPPSALQRCTGDQIPFRLSVAKAVNIIPCCIREKVKYTGHHKVTFLLISVIVRLYLGQSWKMTLCTICSGFGQGVGLKNPSYPIFIFLWRFLIFFNVNHLITTGSQLTVSSRQTTSVIN